MTGGDWVQLAIVALVVGVALGYLGARTVALWRGRSGGCGSSCSKSALREGHREEGEAPIPSDRPGGERGGRSGRASSPTSRRPTEGA